MSYFVPSLAAVSSWATVIIASAAAIGVLYIGAKR